MKTTPMQRIQNSEEGHTTTGQPPFTEDHWVVRWGNGLPPVFFPIVSLSLSLSLSASLSLSVSRFILGPSSPRSIPSLSVFIPNLCPLLVYICAIKSGKCLAGRNKIVAQDSIIYTHACPLCQIYIYIYMYNIYYIYCAWMGACS